MIALYASWDEHIFDKFEHKFANPLGRLSLLLAEYSSDQMCIGVRIRTEELFEQGNGL